MARTVGDVALLLSVIAGPDPRVPLALGDPGARVRAAAARARWPGLRVGYSVDLGGAFAVDPRVAARARDRRPAAGPAGASVFDAHPDLAAGDDTFRTLRAWHFQATFGDLLRRHPDGFKQSLADNIRAGEGLTGADVARAFEQRTALADTMRRFFAEYDVLVLPVSQVPPFPADQEFPTEIDGRPMTSYLDWMRSAYLITVTGCPAISVPAGTDSGGAAGRRPAGRAARSGPSAARDRGRVRGRAGLVTRPQVRSRFWGQPAGSGDERAAVLLRTLWNRKFVKKMCAKPLVGLAFAA